MPSALVVAGVAMCVLPGPGTVTILVGLGLVDFPGKYALQKKLVGKPAILEALNAERARGGVEPLRV